MDHLAPTGAVYQAGTLSGNPVATAAGKAVLELVTDADLLELSARAGTLAASLQDALRSGGLGATVICQGPLLGCFLDETPPAPPTNYDEAKALCGNGRYPVLFHHLLERSMSWAPGAYEVLFPSLAHTDEDFALAAQICFEAAHAISSGTQ